MHFDGMKSMECLVDRCNAAFSDTLHWQMAHGSVALCYLQAGQVNKAKPGEAFRAGQPLMLDEDIEALRLAAAAWLPYQKALGDACLDKGHGWALNHPIVKLGEGRSQLFWVICRPVLLRRETDASTVGTTTEVCLAEG